MLKLLCNRMRRAITWKKRIGLSYLLVILLSKEVIQKKQKSISRRYTTFFSFLKTSGNDNYLTVEHLDVRAYLSELYDQEYSRNSISRKIASLRSFYQFLLKNEAIQENPFSYVHMKKKQLRLPRFFYEKKWMHYLRAHKGSNRLI